MKEYLKAQAQILIGPQENFDRIESQVYRAAMQSGLFLNPKIA